MKKVKQKTKVFYLVALVIFTFFGLITFFGDDGLLKLRKLYALRNQVQKENQALYLNNQRLGREMNQLKEPFHTERLIREKLGYLKSGEYLLILENKNESQAAPNSGSTPSGV